MATSSFPLNEAVHQCKAEAAAIRYQLLGLVDALGRVGMHQVADELADIAERVVIGPAAVSEAFSVDLNNQVRHSEVMMGNLLKATLAGCIVPPASAA